MKNFEEEKKLNRLKIENIIWYVSIGLAILNIISNYYEVEYIKTKNEKYATYYHGINIFIVLVILIIYFYFLIINYSDYQEKKERITSLNLLANSFFVIAVIILLYINLQGEQH